jgi:hypothetical protein
VRVGVRVRVRVRVRVKVALKVMGLFCRRGCLCRENKSTTLSG